MQGSVMDLHLSVMNNTILISMNNVGSWCLNDKDGGL